MKTRLISLILILLLIGSGYIGVRALTKNPCTITKTWSLGPVDSRFGLSQDTVRSYIEGAANTWNKAYASSTLLAYVPTGGDITVTFVYDERQRTTLANESLKQSIAQEKSKLQDIRETLDSLKAEYTNLKTTIAADTATYTAALSKHNKEVAYWNSRGGATRDTYQRLQRESASLETERVMLNQKITRYNSLAEQIQAYGKDHNNIVENVNEKIQTLNQNGSREFEEGTYDPSDRTITIYEFGSTLALKRVLTHELGHALSLSHVDDKDAIMYPINQGKNLTLTDADREELTHVCRERNMNDALAFIKTIRDDIVLLAGWSSSDTAAQGE